MLSTRLATSILGLLIIPGLVSADSKPLWLEPSLKWYGIDGNWSSISIFAGTPSQQIDVTVSTTISEIWLVESSGCSPSALCTAARGNVFDISASNTWDSLGAWQLVDQDYLGQGGNGDYAMDSVAVYDSKQSRQTSLGNQVIAGINTTDYYTGFFGLGITPGAFKSVVVQSPIASLVEQDGVIPSHSYGYTAGAYYAGDGIPVSLVLGGYDSNRFVSHDTRFNLNTTSRQPDVLVRGITASVSSVDKAPTQWDSASLPLLSFNESVTALVDSTTPYLWLPAEICDRFAAALNLTWNETFGLYLFSNDSIYESFQVKDPALSFTFTLSGADNRDSFGQPYDVPGVVNITVSANAFAQTLRYPFMNVIEYGDAAIPYFPLKRVEKGNRIIIGRSFMQEAYMIMNYETSTFGVYQAKFPDTHWNTSIVAMAAYEDSPFPGAPLTSSGKGLTRAQLIGVIVGACMIGVVIMATVWCFLRRKRNRRRRSASSGDDVKEYDGSTSPEPPASPVSKFLSRISKSFSGKKKNKEKERKLESKQPVRRRSVYEVDGVEVRPVEVSADERVHEMATSTELVELDAVDAASINGTTEFGTEDNHNLNTYDMARRKMDRQLQGPVPAYTPSLSQDEPVESGESGEGGKNHQDISPMAHYRPSDNQESLHLRPSPVSTQTDDNLAQPLPSPMTPRTEWSRISDFPLPSPLTFVTPLTFPGSNSHPSISHTPPSPNTIDDRSISRSGSSNTDRSRPISAAESFTSLQPAIQRTPIDPTKIVCLGPLPDNIRPPNQQMIYQQPPIPRLVGPDGHTFTMPPAPYAEESVEEMERRGSTADTLGSNFTVEEEEEQARAMELGVGISRQNTNTFGGRVPPRSPVDSVHTVARIDDGEDLVHIPQLANKRYSWEQDR